MLFDYYLFAYMETSIIFSLFSKSLFIKIVFYFPAFDRINLPVCFGTVGLPLDNDYFFIEQAGRLAHIKEGVRLVTGDHATQFPRLLNLPGLVILLANGDDQAVRLRILVPDKIQLLGARLAGMP